MSLITNIKKQNKKKTHWISEDYAFILSLSLLTAPTKCHIPVLGSGLLV